MKKQLNNRKYLKPRRKKLRNHSTPAEIFLWTLLKGSQLKGYKFRRQHSFGNYIMDFYCPAKKLAVELDGLIHLNPHQAEKDEKRDAYLKDYGIKVLRIENENVFSRTEAVLEMIAEELGRL